MNVIKKNFLYRLPVLLYCTFIFWQSSYPSLDSLPSFAFSDKFMHLGAYGLLGFLVIRALYREKLAISKTWLIFAAILFSTLYGISDEIHQSFVSARCADGFDVIADAAGSTLGILLFHRWNKKKPAPKKHSNAGL
ncbi:MAG: VanZ family protein [Thermodesulfobacteriota bacterium]|nr:VanZ family protein [Thermodesulfobacteriota bacterium]